MRSWKNAIRTGRSIRSFLNKVFFCFLFSYTCIMRRAVNINFKKMSLAYRAHVRLKAKKAGNTIVYIRDGNLIEENPTDLSHVKSKLSTTV